VKRFLSCVEPVDLECVSRIMAAHGHGKKSEAVRFALQQQAARSSQRGAVKRYEPLAAEVNAAADADAGMPRWHQLYRPVDFEVMEFLCKQHNLRSNASAIRFAIRAQAQADGAG
jgi:hypothetical protein